MPTSARKSPSDLVAPSPSFAGDVEYCGVPQDRLLFAVYDTERATKENTLAMYGFCDEVSKLSSEVEDLKSVNKDLTECIRELTVCIRELRDSMAGGK